jgi:hypothetical protein
MCMHEQRYRDKDEEERERERECMCEGIIRKARERERVCVCKGITRKARERERERQTDRDTERESVCEKEDKERLGIVCRIETLNTLNALNALNALNTLFHSHRQHTLLFESVNRGARSNMNETGTVPPESSTSSTRLDSASSRNLQSLELRFVSTCLSLSEPSLLLAGLAGFAVALRIESGERKGWLVIV